MKFVRQFGLFGVLTMLTPLETTAQTEPVGQPCPNEVCQPSPDQFSSLRCTCDQSGRVVFREYEDQRFQIYRETLEYEGDNLVRLQRERSNEDHPGDSDIETEVYRETIDYAYDDDSNVIGQETDFHADGRFDERLIYRYDTSGRRILYEADNDADGIVDCRHVFAYDEQGNQILFERDDNADGVLERRNTSDYDTDGNLLMTEWDDGGDGSIEGRREWTYDTSGRELTFTRDEDLSDDSPDYSSARTYDESGNELTFEVDSDGDGVIDERTVSTYGTDGELLSQERFCFTCDPPQHTVRTIQPDGSFIVEDL